MFLTTANTIKILGVDVEFVVQDLVIQLFNSAGLYSENKNLILLHKNLQKSEVW